MSSEPPTTGPSRPSIGKFEVLAHIASGGMGAVYRAFDTENSREVALKVMNPEMAARPAMLERFKREARSGLKLCHENVVSLYEFGDINGTFFLAMEFVEGTDLHEYLERKGPLDPEQSRQIMIQAARALNHASKQGIVHRDIKPSNFLLHEKPNGQVQIKLSDLGLAREASNEEFRVTRSGTTVGTVDYISPEQARDSGLADIRSDLYSLGCTWYHMLAGQAPFSEGGLAERLLKHMTSEPPDLRKFNPRVSDRLVAVLDKLLAKKPEERYQTPQELLEELLSLEAVAKPASRKVLAAVGGRGDEASSELPRRSSGTRKSVGRRKSASGRDTDVARPRTVADRLTRGKAGVLVGMIAALVILGGVAGYFVIGARRHAPAKYVPGQSVASVEPVSIPTPLPAPPLVSPSPPAPSPVTVAPKPVPTPTPAPTPARPRWPALYKPATALNVAHLREEFERPWAMPAAGGAGAPVLHVGRSPVGSGGSYFPSLGAAFAAAAPGRTTVIEVSDNGPLFETPAAASDRSIVIRAAKGFRPLIVWDVQRTLDERKSTRPAGDDRPFTFFEVQRGGLHLEEIDLVLQWPDRLTTTHGTLVQVSDGDLSATGCTFSVAGKARSGVTLARLTGSRPEGGRCRLTRCLGRGVPLIGLEVDLPGAEVLLDRTLLAGGEPALLQVKGANSKPLTLRMAQSTLVAAHTLLSIQPTSPAERDPAVRWMAWDTLLSRSNRQAGGEMIVLRDGAGTRGMRCDAWNCLYTGWDTLLAADTVLGRGQMSAWRMRWNRTEGDEARETPWPATAFAELGEVPTAAYRTANTPVAFASTLDPEQPLGCPLESLPTVRESWLMLTYERFLAPAIDPGDGTPPLLPTAAGPPYEGEMIDLSKGEDLGLHLQQLRKTQKFAARVVLHLTGTGERNTSPILVPRGTSLTLYFEPPPETDSPLALVATVGRDTPSRQALIEMEEGNLDIIGGDLRLGEAMTGRGLPWLLKVQGGDLRLYRTRLQGPIARSASSFRSLVDFTGSGATPADQARNCVVAKSVLVSGGDGIHLRGLGCRFLLHESLVVAGGAGLILDPGESLKERANSQCILYHSTLAGRRAALHLCDAPITAPLLEPVVIQSSFCAFLNPFPPAGNRGGLLAYDGLALARGLLLWQAEGDAFDRRLHFRAAPTLAIPDKPQSPGTWLALWGSSGDRRPLGDVTLSRLFDQEKWPLERLVFGKNVGPEKAPPAGADLDKLGVIPRKHPKPR
jgi:serine/threonine-protein kinase